MAEFLYEKIDNLLEFGDEVEIPACITENLNPSFELRPYQISAFQHFLTYFNNKKLRSMPTQVLFHMATGSGKTLIMAGLIIYLYKKGYRNFLFFVSLSMVVKKTKDNFLNSTSAKYLFADSVVVDGENVRINEVTNFQSADKDAINICFTTIQGLHSDMTSAKENSVTWSDFEDMNVVLIADEAHHLNADTKKDGKKKKVSEAEQLEYESWESVVNGILDANAENILLEFTATCDLSNPQIKASYMNKIVYDYQLKYFYKDKYSKDIRTLRSDVGSADNPMPRALQALVLSQYRLKVFQEYRINVKPVVLFKAATIAESKKFMGRFEDAMKNLKGEDLQNLFAENQDETVKTAFAYFQQHEITFDMLAMELKEAFSAAHCISANE